MFSALTSLTGGGGLQSSSSSSADGDNTFSNAFNYRTGAQETKVDNNLLVLGALALAVFFVVKRGI